MEENNNNLNKANEDAKLEEERRKWREEHGLPIMGVAFVESADWQTAIKKRHNDADKFKGKEI